MRILLRDVPRRLLAPLLLAAAALPAAAAPQDPAPAPPAAAGDARHAEKPGLPVVVWNRTVVELRAVYPPRSLEERVADVTARIAAVPAEDQEATVETIPSTMAGMPTLLLAIRGRPLVLLSAEDVPHGSTLEAHAKTVAASIGEVLAARRAQAHLPTVLRGAALSLAALVAAALLLLGLVRVRRRIEARIAGAAEARRLSVAGVDTSAFLQGIARLAVRAAALVAGGVVAYLVLTFALAQFPYTSPLGRRLGGFLLGVLARIGGGILGAAPGLFMAGVIFYLARLADRAQGAFFQGIIDGRITVSWMDPEPARATRRLGTAAVWAFAIVLAYPYLPGSDTEAFKGVSVLVGLMVSMGSAGIVNQMMSGFVITYSRALKPGDWVRIGETVGEVRAVGVLSTKILTPTRELVTIPNAVLVGDRVINYTPMAAADGAVLSTAVTIGYDAPWRQVHRLLLGAAAAVPRLRTDPAPFVLQTSLSDFYVSYELRAHHDRPEERPRILSELHAAIQDAFNEAGVQIMSPNFEAQPASPVLVPKDRWEGTPPDGAPRKV